MDAFPQKLYVINLARTPERWNADHSPVFCRLGQLLERGSFSFPGIAPCKVTHRFEVAPPSPLQPSRRSNASRPGPALAEPGLFR